MDKTDRQTDRQDDVRPINLQIKSDRVRMDDTKKNIPSHIGTYHGITYNFRVYGKNTDSTMPNSRGNNWGIETDILYTRIHEYYYNSVDLVYS